MKLPLLLSIASLALTLTSLLQADSWPQFRGPDGSAALAASEAIPTAWGGSKNLKWKTALPGPGSSSPVYWGDRLFVTCYTGYGTDQREIGKSGDLGRQLLCLDRHTGKILWKRPIKLANPEDDYRGYLMEHGYASSTPVTDGKIVYVFFGKSGVHAFSVEGKELWSKPVGTDSSNRRWGSAASPILLGDLLIVNAADEGRAVIAFDKKTGEERWRHESRQLELAYGTPVVHSLAGGGTELVLSVPEELWGLDPATGKRRWFATTRIPGNVCPTVVIDKGIIFSSGGHPHRTTVAVKSGGQGDITKDVLWTSKVATYVPSPVVLDGHAYVVNEDAEAVCMEMATGKVVTKREVEGIDGTRRRTFYASTIRVGDRLFAVSRTNGTYVFEAKPGMKKLARNHLGDDSDFNATPAVARDALYLRSNKAIYCIAK